MGGCIFSWLFDRVRLALFALSSMKGDGDLKVNHLHVSVNGMNQLPHVEGLLFISNPCLALDTRPGGGGVSKLDKG